MPKFSYTAKNLQAQTVSGVVEAENAEAVARELKKRNLAIISITEEKEKEFERKGGKIKVREMVVFSRQLSTLINAGISLVASLNILYSQFESEKMRRIIANIRSDIEAGTSLSSSFAKYSHIFPPIFSNMIKAGETSGSLDEILNRLAEYLERTENLKRKVKSALTYPVLVVVMAAVIVSFLMLKVVPAFKSIFEGLGGTLPLLTRVLIKTSDVGVQMFPFFLILGVLVFIGFIRFIHTENGRMAYDRFKLRLPLFGSIIKKITIGRVMSTLATLLKSGVDILEALEIASKVAGNKVVEEAVKQTKQGVRTGESIAEPMERTGEFAPFVVKMIAVGEQAGELEEMLTKISDYYEAEVNETLSSLTSMMEPVIIAFLGVTIGFIVVAMYLPIFKVTQLVVR
ncbi:MAG: type II secretion system F family protein [Candidatus Omnitrophota bacterium]|nr:MAG: type II secretion system F family protein [Candidatus Omnitrophota bacterium]